MKRKPNSWSVKQVSTMISKGTITFDNPVQRKSGQWNEMKASLLIDSILRMFIPPLFAIQVKKEKGNVYDIIDGLQRLTYIMDYINDKFALSDNLYPVCLETTNENYVIAGKKFSELHTDVQDSILSYMLTFSIIELDEADDEESVVDDIFYRLNNGTPVSKEHMVFISASRRIQNFVRNLVDNSRFFKNVASFTNSQMKKSDCQMAIIQSIVLASGLEFDSFAAKDVEKFINQNDSEITDELLQKVRNAFDNLSNGFEDQRVKFMQKIHISSFVNLLVNADNKAESVIEFIKWYIKNTNKGDDYRVYCGAGSTKIENVKNRTKALANMLNNYCLEKAS